MPATFPSTSDPSVEVLHEASGVVAVRKPAGIATQAPAAFDSMERRLRAWLGGRSHGGYLGVPHRLDRPVSGVLLFATTPRAARQLSRQFERRQVRKAYRALLEPPAAGRVEGNEAWQEWRDRIVKVADQPRARIVAPGEECAEAREAITRVWLTAAAATPLAAAGVAGATFEPVTGRMHQLRIQSACRGMPVVGDSLYGATTPFGDEAIALHASRIEFLDPDTKRPVVVECPPPW